MIALPVAYTNAATISLTLESDSTYRHTHSDAQFNVLFQNDISIAPVIENFDINVDVNSSGPRVSRSESIFNGEIIQYTTSTAFDNYSFDLLSLFQPVVQNFVSDQFMTMPSGLFRAESKVVQSVLFNDFTDPNEGDWGNVDLYFSEFYGYESYDNAGTPVVEYLSLSGVVEFEYLNTIDQYQHYQDMTLSELLEQAEFKNAGLYIGHDRYYYETDHFVDPAESDNFFIYSYGFVSSVSVPAPASIAFLGMALMLMYTRRGQRKEITV